MPLLALIKTKPLLCSLAGVGTVAAPAAAICYATDAFSSPLKRTYSPPTFEALKTDSKLSVIDQKPSGCFNSFFPGVKIGDETNTGHDGNIADRTVDDGKLIGCALMKFDYTDSSQFAFSAEIAAKNDSHGWAIKIYLQPKNTSSTADSNYTYRFTYNIVFLKRNSSAKTWSVEGGIYLEPSSPGDPTTNISFPDKTILTANNRDSSISSVTSKTWFATWEESSGDKEIFDDIRVDYDQHNTLYLGRPSSVPTDQCSADEEEDSDEDNDGIDSGFSDCNCAIKTRMDPKKTYGNHQWSDNTGSIEDVCSRYKAQLQGKKGSWSWQEDPSTFCQKLQTEHLASADDLTKKNKLSNYCYAYQ